MLARMSFCEFFGHVRTDWLRWVVECGVGTVDQNLGDNGDGVTINPASPHLVLHGTLKHPADGTLCIGAGIVHGHGRDFGDGNLRPAQDEPDLRAVAVRQDHIPALFNHVRDMTHGDRRCGILVGYRLVVGVDDQ